VWLLGLVCLWSTFGLSMNEFCNIEDVILSAVSVQTLQYVFG
jgi:hypothetical protein